MTENITFKATNKVIIVKVTEGADYFKSILGKKKKCKSNTGHQRAEHFDS